MKNEKKRFAVLAVFLTVFSGTMRAQDKRPEQAAIVDSFKQKIQEVLNKENSDKGIEHAAVVSGEAKTSALHAKRKMVHKDGSPCGAFHSGWCHDIWVDDSGAEYVNDAGKSCDPTQHPDTCHVMGKPHINLVWTKLYTEPVSKYSFDVKVTDSLVTPYTGVLSYSEISRFTVEHPTKGEAENDNNFTSSLSNSFTFTYGYQDGQWKLLK